MKDLLPDSVKEDEWQDHFQPACREFGQMIRRKDAQAAWKLLSDSTEDLLEDSKGKGGRRRSHITKPVILPKASKKTCKLMSVLERRLHKLYRKLLQKLPWTPGSFAARKKQSGCVTQDWDIKAE